jgi:hypothetical protein
MQPTSNLSNSNGLSNDSDVNHQVLIKEIMKMRTLNLEEKEKVLDVLAEIMGYQQSCESAIEEEAPLQNQVQQPQQIQSQIVDQNGKKVLQVSGNGYKLIIRGYKAEVPRGTTLIRYRLNTNGQDEPLAGLNTKSHKFGHTKDKIIEKMRAYLGASAEKAISDFAQYDASFYNKQG